MRYGKKYYRPLIESWAGLSENTSFGYNSNGYHGNVNVSVTPKSAQSVQYLHNVTTHGGVYYIELSGVTSQSSLYSKIEICPLLWNWVAEKRHFILWVLCRNSQLHCNE